MAPNFFSKLVKGSPASHTRERLSSEHARGRSPSPARQRANSISTAGPRISANTAATSAPSVKSANSNGAAENSDSGSTNPNVTVVPPSPHTTETSQLSSGSKPSLNDPNEHTHDSRVASDSTGVPAFGTKNPSLLTEDDLPTPTAAQSITMTPSATDGNTHDHTYPLTGTQSRTLAPSSSTGNLREFVQSHSSTTPTPALDIPQIRHQKSNKSLAQQPPSISTSHPRAATVPDIAQDTQNGIYNSMSPIVESPKDMRPAVDFPTQSIERSSTTFSTAGSTLIPSREAEATPGTEKKKRPWRRSNTRKPTGLASAIAASGLAMANPVMSAPQHAQLSPPALANVPRTSSTARKASLPGSPPKLSHSRQPSADISPRSTRTNRSKQSVVTQQASMSVNSEHNYDMYGDERAEFSGLGEDSSEDDDSESEEDMMDLDLGEDDIPVTGFAVASNKRNADFHELFPSVPEGDYLIEDYGCALQREILIQGRLYISENHICFHANIFGWITDLSIPIYEITSLEKKMTAFVIPNAIQITTRQAKYTFASFLSRDTTFDVIFNIWRLARPEDSASIMSSAKSVDGPADRHAVSAEMNGILPAPAVPSLANKVTQCACGKEGKHFTELALETILPGTPDRIHNLIFASGFIKDFMRVDQKLADIQISDWTPISPGSTLLARNMSYIKPLNASVGPKQTKCEIRDETLYRDFEDYVVMLTTTRTPDVPSGGVFSVKTKTCFMWASAVSTKVIVTTQVEWTGRSFIKSIIERSAIDGQKQYHADLDKAMRVYIQEHQSEFTPEGIDLTAIAPSEPEVAAPDVSGAKHAHEPSVEEERKQREHERNQRGLQWAWDTIEGAYQVAKRSTTGALELVKDAWEHSTSTAILYFVIVILVFSNLWTLTRMGSREEAGRRKELKRMEEREQWVQGVVTAVWDELVSGKAGSLIQHQASYPGMGTSGPLLSPTASRLPAELNWREEVAAIESVLESVEERVQLIKQSLTSAKNLKEVD